MSSLKRSAAGRQIVFPTWRDLSPMNASVESTLGNLTGSWRFIRPIFENKTPPCQNGCPAGNDIEGWVGLLQRGAAEEAYWLLKQEQPFPAVLGRVCYRFCQTACNRATLDRAVGIGDLERVVGEAVPAITPPPDLPALHEGTLAVIGSGPAGMSAAYFARRLGFNVTVFEAEKEPGGLLRLGIPAYRLPREIVAAEFVGLSNMGITLRTGIRIDATGLKRLRQEYDYLFLALGRTRSLNLEVAGAEGHPRVMSGLELLRRVARGNKPDLGRRVVVIGGGNTALDAARTAIRLGAAVTVLYRRGAADMPAHPEEVREAIEEGIDFEFMAAPERIETKAMDGTIELWCAAMIQGPPDETGRPRPVKMPGAGFAMKADTVIGAIGESPDLGFLGDLVRPAGSILAVDRSSRIEIPGEGRARIYAGGDISAGPYNVIEAVASGKRAALAMDMDRRGLDPDQIRPRITVGSGPALSLGAYLGEVGLGPPRLVQPKVVGPEGMVFDYYQKKHAIEPVIEVPEIRKQGFAPYRETLGIEDRRSEAERCLHCGRCRECDNCVIFCPDVALLVKEGGAGYEIDYDYCKGCGICQAECPRGAMTMVEEPPSRTGEG